ncbi:hypothetical protein ACMXYQ_11725 [Neptuniibacter sp. PT34_22]|uniref:hypothetical protein n=1 Tax=Neptuniibacter sp. PT34_22 TaxID=3398205 RepID=UPI0039F4E7FD
MSNPVDVERRNLMMTCIGFILFYFGEGQIIESGKALSLPIGIKLNNTDVLFTAAWIALFYFLWRYWLLGQKKLREFCTYGPLRFITEKQRDAVLSYVLKNKTYEDHPAEEAKWFISMINRNIKSSNPLDWVVEIEKRTEIGGGAYRVVQDTTQGIQLKWYELFRTKFRVIVKYSFTYEKFSDLILPYVMALAAIVCGLLRYVYPPEIASALPV